MSALAPLLGAKRTSRFSNMSGIRNSQTLTILIERQPDGEYAAIDEANHELGWTVGYGKTSAPPSRTSSSRWTNAA